MSDHQTRPTAQPSDDYSTEKFPGHLPVLLSEKFRNAGITPFNELRERFADNFQEVVAYIGEKRREAEDWRHHSCESRVRWRNPRRKSAY